MPEDLWVFGYGSLMWDPGFPHREARAARLIGYHRALCVLSVRNRGTRDRPGLALGLARGGSCRGIAFRIAGTDADAARDYLWEREMANNAYHARVLPVRLLVAAEAGASMVDALVFVSRRDHPQHMAGLTPVEAARLVAQGAGLYGTALDYLRNTVAHLDDFGINDGPLHRVLALAEALAAGRST